MSKATIKSIRESIKMYDMEQDIEVIDYDDVMTAPYPDRYVVRHRQFGDPWKMDYLCRTLEDVAHCVNKVANRIGCLDD